ncbi:DNA repair protein rad10 [Violaceomyces palustris]|uniref:DNA repair protein rad10 n=1 Tax=Violaceomyces palustris TaxID=1673888 RepID=A0ACD0P2X3_9BASI|nr:DNA repair protein rad10 [Violaceomyces palustris]
MSASIASTSTRAEPVSRSGVVQPRPKPLIRGAQGGGSTILVNNCQRGNPVLQHIRNVGWEYADIVPDYQVGIANCVLFLSLRYHRLHPEYIHTRIQKLQQMFTLRVLLVMCDVKDHQPAIKELTKVSIINDLTMMVAWTPEEAGRYIETYKSFEHKPPDLIKERVSDDYMSQLTSVLTCVRGVNKTDVITLASRFGSLKRISTATVEELSMCPGFGELKAKRLRDAFHLPFRVGETRSRKERRMEEGVTAGESERRRELEPVPSRFQVETSAAAAAAEASDDAPSKQVESEEEHVADEQDPGKPPEPEKEEEARGRTEVRGSAEAQSEQASQNDFDQLSEEEQIRLAIEMSMANPEEDLD